MPLCEVLKVLGSLYLYPIILSCGFCPQGYFLIQPSHRTSLLFQKRNKERWRAVTSPQSVVIVLLSHWPGDAMEVNGRLHFKRESGL